MAKSRREHATKSCFKLPQHITKERIDFIVTTARKISVHGYTGKINQIKSAPSKKDGTFVLCVADGNHGARAWVKLKDS